MTTKLATLTEQSSLPAGWRWARLGDVCHEDRIIVEPDSPLAANLPYLSLEHIESETGKILGTGNLSDVRSTTFAFDARHVLYGKLRPYLNKVALPDFKGRCTTELIPLLRHDVCERDYLAMLLRRPETVVAAMQEKTGSRMPRADLDKLMELAVPLPSLPEQCRIAARLNEVMAEIARARTAAQAALDAAKVLPAALLRAVFESDEAKGWKSKQIGTIATVTSGGTPSRGNADYYEGKIPWVKTTELQDNSIDDTEEHISEDGLRDSAAKVFPVGTLLVALYGQGQTRGRTAILNIEAATNQACAAILPNPKEFVPTFLQLWFRHKYLEIRAYAENHNNTQANLSGGYIKSLEPPLPSLEAQQQTIARLSAQVENAQQVRTSAQSQLDAINALPAAYLRKAFRGEL